MCVGELDITLSCQPCTWGVLSCMFMMYSSVHASVGAKGSHLGKEEWRGVFKPAVEFGGYSSGTGGCRAAQSIAGQAVNLVRLAVTEGMWGARSHVCGTGAVLDLLPWRYRRRRWVPGGIPLFPGILCRNRKSGVWSLKAVYYFSFILLSLLLLSPFFLFFYICF